jgi:hypothetical protein
MIPKSRAIPDQFSRDLHNDETENCSGLYAGAPDMIVLYNRLDTLQRPH